MNSQSVAALILERQGFEKPAATANEYKALFRDMAPVMTPYWCAPGSPPRLVHRAVFDDAQHNARLRAQRKIVKGRFQNGSIAYIFADQWEIYGALYRKPITVMTPEQRMLWEFLQREGPMSIGIMKEMTGLKVKEITPILHRLQQAFLLFEDQEDSEGDRSWYIFGQEFSEASFLRYTRQQALCEIIPRLIYRNVWMDRDMLHSFLCLPPKEIEPAIQELIEAGVIHSCDLNNKEGFVLCQDMDQQEIEPARSVFALHRNDFLVKCNEAWLKKTFDAAPYEVLYYLLVDGRFAGIAAGKFHNGPFDVEDIRLSLAMDEGAVRKEEILAAMEKVCDPLLSPVKRYQGLPL